MKIAYILNEYPAKSETFIYNQIKGLNDLGYKVNVYAFKPGTNNRTKGEPFDDRSLLDICYYNIPETKLKLYLKGILNALKIIRISPKKLFRIFNHRANKQCLIGIFRILNIIECFLPKKKYDIIQCHFGDMGLVAERLINIGFLKGELIVAFHGKDMTALINKNGIRLYDVLYHNAALLLPVCERWRKALISWGAPKQSTIVHHMGIDVEFFKPHLNNKIHNKKLTIVSVCRLVPKKGIEYAIIAIFMLVKKRNIDINYIIVGDGPQRNSLERLAFNLGILDKYITFKGFQPQVVVKNMIQLSDIFVAPSLTSKDRDQEGIPVAIMEAMALAIPVISTAHSAIPELIEDNVSGLLIKERSWRQIEKNILFLHHNIERTRSIGLNGRKKVVEQFNVKKLNQELIGLYKEIF